MRQLLILLCVMLLGCQKSKEFGPQSNAANVEQISNSSAKLIIGCEGNFQASNASITLYDPNAQVAIQEVYRNTNNQGLGDVLQSMHLKGDSLFLVLNNSNAIKIVDAQTLTDIATVSSVSSPRYMEHLGGDSFIVSSLVPGNLSLIDLNGGTKTKLNSQGWTEQMLKVKGGLIVADRTELSLSLYNNDLQLQKTTLLNFDPVVLEGKDGLLVAGGYDKDDPNFFHVAIISESAELLIDKRVEGRFVDCQLLGNAVYVLESNEVIKYSALTLDKQDEWKHHAQTPYALHVDSLLEEFYLTDVKDYISKGRVLRYNKRFTRLDEIETGFIPQSMIIRYSQ